MWMRRLKYWMESARRSEALREEMELHLAEKAAELQESGMTPESAAAVYAPAGRLLGAGDLLRLPDLADTLEHLGRRGPAAMRDGDLAAAVADHLGAEGGFVTFTLAAIPSDTWIVF